MVFSDADFDALLSDESKRIDRDITWSEDEDHSLSREFLVEVTSSVGWPLVVRGSYNPFVPALTYALILKTVGRIYALCLGKDHHNPTCDWIGDRHKHRWNEKLRDKEAYVPQDITATASQIHLAWEQFLRETRITHHGVLQPYPPIPRGLFW